MRRPLAVVVVAVATLAACTGSSSDGDAPSTTAPRTASSTTAPSTSTSTTVAEPEAYTGDDFYAVPEELPDAPHGTLLRYEEVTPTVQEGATTYRILYTSESLEGEQIAVSGTALVPTAAAPEEGRRILTVAHGTTGIADECAPSKAPGGELLLFGPQIAEGWLIAETDYEGLGTPGRHPYLVGESEGRGTTDAALAAGQLPGADPGDQLAIAGYSQGGHGALWAGQVAAEWAPDLDVVGTFAGAPATEMALILRGAPDGFKFMMIAGFAAAYPEADPALYLTPEGVSRLDTVDTGCTRDIFAALAGVADADLLLPDAAASGPWATIPPENDPGRVRVDAPILIIHSDEDATVPVVLSGLLTDRMCGLGQVVERRVVAGGGSHTEAAPQAYRDGLAWLEQRFDASAEPVSTCTP